MAKQGKSGKKPPVRPRAVAREIREEADPQWRAWFQEVERRRKKASSPDAGPWRRVGVPADGRGKPVVRRVSQPRAIATLLRDTGKPFAASLDKDRLRIQAAWNAAVGPEVAAHTSVHSFRQGILTVTVAGSGLLQEIRQFHEQAILKDLRDVWQASQPLLSIRYRVGKRSDSRVVKPAMGLYVHLPFCASRCGYCAFVSSPYQAERAERYLQALEMELDRRRAEVGRQPASLFIGGGTPSILPAPQLSRLLAFLPFPPNGGEATCELNPDSTTPETLSLLRDAGITRCSFGVQTFDPAGLRRLERRHDADTAVRAVAMAQKAGFAALSVDLIMGWPGQTPALLAQDIRQAVALGVQHISCYQLTLEETAPGYGRLASRMGEESDEDARRLWDTAEETLAACGFEHYETSNFSQPGFRCRHNVAIWEGGQYVGLGAAAHSHVAGSRFANTDDVEEYIARTLAGDDARSFSETLTREEKARECAVFWLRLLEGIDTGRFEATTGCNLFSLYGDTLAALLDARILEQVWDSQGNERVRVSHKYHPTLDAVLVDLV